VTRLSLVIVSFIVAATAFAGTRFEAQSWQAVQEFDAVTLEKSLGSHTGQWIAVKFNFRGKDIHHLKPGWYEGSIWGANPAKSGKFAHVRVMVAKKDVPAFKAITTDSTSAAPLTGYGKVARDFDANFLFVRLIGTRATVDPAGNATVDW
jgi:hypothetical protein